MVRNNLDISDFVELYNPFLLRDRRGKLMVFKDYQALYKETLERLWQSGPYYIDMVLFVKDQIEGMTLKDAERFVASWRRRGGKRESEWYLFDWRNGEVKSELYNQVVEIMTGLHSLSETNLNFDMLRSAFDEFMSGICKMGKFEGRVNYVQQFSKK